MITMAERCLHGLHKTTCALCSPPRPVRVPVRSEKVTAHGAAAGMVDPKKYGIAVVRTANTSRGHVLINIESIEPDVEVVHIAGSTFLWVFDAILAHLPKLTTIQVIPSALDRVGGSARTLCAARNVRIVSGHVRPELAWDDDRIGNPLYDGQRRFLLGMSGEQLALFDELIALGFDAAKMTARYFCLNGETYAPQRLLAADYGYAKGAIHAVSGWILAVLYYLDSTVEVGQISHRRASSLREHVAKLRPLLASAEHRQRLIRDLGVPAFADGFPLARVEVFKKLLIALRTGRLDRLKRDSSRSHEAIVLRFGLDRVDAPVYRTLKEVGEMMGGITRERARQLEEQALECLGIKEEDA